MRKALILLPFLALIGCGQARTVAEMKDAHPHGTIIMEAPAGTDHLGVLILEDFRPAIDPDTGVYSCPTVRYEQAFNKDGVIVVRSSREVR